MAPLARPSRSHWPRRFQELCRRLAEGDMDGDRQSIRGELWLVLHEALFQAVARHAGRYGTVSLEDLEDIASQKAIDLLSRIESGSLDLTDRAPGQVVSYVSSVAERGLMDLFRDHARRSLQEPDDTDKTAATTENAESRVEGRDFADALLACVEKLQDRTRTIWFFRVFYDMSSKDIARHPEVRLKPSHVDVLLHRCRDRVRDCMHEKGHDSTTMPTGTLVVLWQAFRMERSRWAPQSVA